MNPYLLMIALCLLCGCATWNSQSLAPDAVIQRRDPEQLQVVCTSGAVVELAQPRVDGDSLRGVAADGPRAIALADVDHVAVFEIKTSVRILVLVGVGVFFAAAAVASEWQ